MHKQQRWPQAWEYCQTKPIQTLGRASQGVNWSWSQCIKSHHAQTSSGKEPPSHFWNRNIVRSILPGLRRKINGLLISDPKSSFQMKVHFAFHLEIKVPESGGRVERNRIHVAWSPVWSFHSQWWFGLHFTSFCWQALWRYWFHFPAGLGTCPHCQRYQKLVQWPWCYCARLASKLTWPELLSRGRWETPDPTMQMTRRLLSKQPGLHYTWAVPQADCLHATPHWCSNSCKRSPNQVSSA